MAQLRGDVQHTLDVYNMRSGNPVTIKVVDTIEDFDGNADVWEIYTASGRLERSGVDALIVLRGPMP